MKISGVVSAEPNLAVLTNDDVTFLLVTVASSKLVCQLVLPVSRLGLGDGATSETHTDCEQLFHLETLPLAHLVRRVQCCIVTMFSCFQFKLQMLSSTNPKAYNLQVQLKITY